MIEQFDNPMGIDGFEFVEFAAPDAAVLEKLFAQFGFSAVARHRSKNITLYKQGDCVFLLNDEAGSFAKDFAAIHGPCACGFAMRVKDADFVYQATLEKGAQAFNTKPATLALDIPCIEGIGGSILYLVDKYGDTVYLPKEFNPGCGQTSWTKTLSKTDDSLAMRFNFYNGDYKWNKKGLKSHGVRAVRSIKK